MLSVLYPAGVEPVVDPLQDSVPEPPSNTVTFDRPYRPSTRLSDIDEEKEHGPNHVPDDASSCGSWQDLPESEKKRKNEEAMLPSRKDYDDFYRAAASGKLDVLNRKLDLGVDIERESNQGFTALVIAISEVHVDAVRLLLDRGADVHHRVHELPPLAHAASRTHHGPELLQLLIDHGAILTTTSRPDQRNVLHCAAAVGTPDTVEFLVTKGGMDIEKKCRRGCTPLLVAARAGNVDNAKVLLKLGAKLDAVSINGGSALIWSSSWGNVDAIKYWLELGLDINARDNNGHSKSCDSPYCPTSHFTDLN